MIDSILSHAFSFTLGLLSFIIFFSIRCIRSGEFDFSNWGNPLRVLTFIATHADIIPYLRNIQVKESASFKKKFPFWFTKYDEHKDILANVPKPDDLREPGEVTYD